MSTIEHEDSVRIGHLVVISPHLDDAVFSTWWHLGRASRVTVITVFAGVPPAGIDPPSYDRFTGSHDPAERARVRRAEDRAIVEGRGWKARHLDFLDEPYRTAAPDLEAAAAAIAAAVPDGCDLVLVPAAIGGHTDHCGARDAALRALRSTSSPVRLHADLPYAAMYGWPHWVRGGHADRYLSIDSYYAEALSTISGWRVGDATVHQLATDAQAAKLKAMQAYRTQYPAQEAGPSRWLSHPERLPFEVSWAINPDPVGPS